MLSVTSIPTGKTVPSWSLIFIVCCVALAGGLQNACAQLQLELSFSRHSYLLYEPIVATVSITNFAGRDLVLEDVPGKPWLNMEVTTLDGSVISPYDPNTKLNTVQVPAGQTVKRQIDLTPNFPIRELAEHRVRADIYLAEADRFYYSNYVTFDVTGGKTIWRQTVGVPGDRGGLREISLITHRLLDRVLLYVRIRDVDGDTVYVTRTTGRLVATGNEPEVMLDRNNTLHVIQEAAPGAYLYTVVNVDGERLSQKAYNRLGASRPKLVKSEAGVVDIRGGQIQVAPALAVGGAAGAAPARQPKLSDRPAGMPLAKPAEQ